MSTSTPASIVEPFAASGTRNVIPVADPGHDGLASYDAGFPVITQTPLIVGGKPPNRPDMNGVLYALSTHTVWLIGGMPYQYSSSFSAKQTGYGAGAVLQSSATASSYWRNITADNTNNPDSVSTGWVPFCPSTQPLNVQTATPDGTPVAVALNTGVGFLDVTPTADATITSITGAYDGQRLIVTNLHATFLLTLADSGNMRLPSGGVALAQYMSLALTWSASLSKWVAA